MRRFALSLVLIASATALQAAVKPASMFTDNAVLQAGVAVPVWGTAEPGEEVSVTFGGQTKKVKADSAGKWSVKLSKLKASSEPRLLTMSSAASTLQLTNVLVGEVWVCSGQSNMEWPMSKAHNASSAIPASADAELRLFLVNKAMADEPTNAVAGSWVVCGPNNLGNFSAVGYFFGRDLRTALKKPVGLIGTYWGGTPAEAWTRKDVLANNPELVGILTNHEHRVKTWDPEKAKKAFKEQQAKWSNDVAKAKAEGKPVPAPLRAPQDPRTSPHRPGCLYNAMIAPVVPYAIAGATWYQGESNAGRSKEYETLLPAMIENWRNDFGVGKFPFLIVQISSYRGQPPTIREAQLNIEKNTPETAMVVSADVGNENDIHPTEKEPVGARLALAARKLAYGEDVEYSGPRLKSAKMGEGKAVLTFERAQGGLVAEGGTLKYFTIAGADSNFVAATATIVNPRTIEVSSPAVPKPAAVRYGWTNYFDADLFDKAGLPATPFRTDTW